MGGGYDFPEVSNRDIREALLALSRAVTTQVNLSMVPRKNVVESTMISRLRDFMRMNPPIFLFTKVGEDPKVIIDVVYRIVLAMGVPSREKVEFASYKLKDVAQVWYIQWKCNRRKSRVLLSGKNLMKLFLVSTFHVR